ncbi:MAG: hypothetical protein HY298_00840 [Verrucomicrobia bacterium]|nr:hypothetical protein [Verrucomicrobiota bacterium]
MSKTKRGRARPPGAPQANLTKDGSAFSDGARGSGAFGERALTMTARPEVATYLQTLSEKIEVRSQISAVRVPTSVFRPLTSDF